MRHLSREEVRRVDRIAIEQWAVPGVLLMENAGRGATDVICQRGVHGLVLIVCAKGNNGGDGFVVARHLHLRGHRVEVVLTSEPNDIAGDALVNFQLLKKCSVHIRRYSEFSADEFSQKCDEADWLIDAMLGTGARGEPRAPLPEIISTMNGAKTKRMALDIPTGLDAETGDTSKAQFVADHTCTFVAPKIGFLNPAAAKFLGQIHTLDIGLPQELVQQAIDTSNYSN